MNANILGKEDNERQLAKNSTLNKYKDMIINSEITITDNLNTFIYYITMLLLSLRLVTGYHV